jgi:proteic killer suppression protein
MTRAERKPTSRKYPNGKDVSAQRLETPVREEPAERGSGRSARIRDVLAHLDRAQLPADLDLPGYRLHALKGRLKGYWSVTVSGNWRIVFRFEDGSAFDVDLVDYH